MNQTYEYEVGVLKLPLPKNANFTTKLLQKEMYRAMSVNLAQAHGIKFTDIENSQEYKKGNWSIYVPGTKEECLAEARKLLHSFEMPGVDKIKRAARKMLKRKPTEDELKSMTQFEKINMYLSGLNISIVHTVRQKPLTDEKENSNEGQTLQPA